MKATINNTEYDLKHLIVTVPVRYGEEDMAKDAPLRSGDTWQASIDLDTKKINGWREGNTLEFYMKVVDGGTYTLHDVNDVQVAAIEQNYVPNNLLPGEYGDYLELKIGKDGTILNWLENHNFSDFENGESND